MAGDAWVVDIIWHAMMLVGNVAADLWSKWTMEILLAVSFTTQLVLGFLAGFRWRGASRPVRGVILVFYVGAEYVATTALGHLSISGASGDRRLVAFWAPFFLLHLGGPDSITAYQLEDNELSRRYVLELLLLVLGALYVVYESISGSWTLVPAAWLMVFVGVAKYVERTLALHLANLVNLRISLEKQQRRRARGGQRRHQPKAVFFARDEDEDLVMRAHYLFHICKRAIVDSSVETASDSDTTAHTKETLFKQDWKSLCKVIEMELSLMYDFLYTKAAVIHTWHGYLIRILSPLFCATALLLVELSNRSGCHRQSDIWITRILLVATFLLETASLIRALGSSWTGFLLYNRLPQGWIHHQAFCARRWSRFHRAVASLGQLAKVQTHRSWSGHMGQVNLLHLIVRRQRSTVEQEFWGNIERDGAQTVVIPEEVKEFVFRRVHYKLAELRDSLKKEAANRKSNITQMDFLKISQLLRTKRGQHVLEDHGLSDLRWSLGNELQVGILIWHIATDIYLSESGKAEAEAEDGTRRAQQVKAIRMLSNYMLFLLAVRPDMLPGLVTRKLFELICEDLARIWLKHADQKMLSSRNPQALSSILYEHLLDPSDAFNPYLLRGVGLGADLLKLEQLRNLDMLTVIFEVWVDMLFYASYRCSKESHAKQLSNGGELTTIVWLMAEHVGLFVIRKTTKDEEVQSRKRSKYAV